MRRAAIVFTLISFAPVVGFAKTIVVPQITNGPHWKTKIRLYSGYSAVPMKARIFRSDGTPWFGLGMRDESGSLFKPDGTGEISLPMPPGREAAEYTCERNPGSSTDPTGVDVSGYLVCVVDDKYEEISVSGIATYYPAGINNSQAGEQPGQTQLTLLPSPLYTNADFPVDPGAAIAICNPSPDPLRITVYVVLRGNFDEVIQGGRSMVLDGYEQRAFFLSEVTNISSILGKHKVGSAGISTGSSRDFAVLPVLVGAGGSYSAVPIIGNHLTPPPI